MANAQFCVLNAFFSSGAIQGAAKLYHYSAGTSTLKNIWSDRAESTTLAQPFVADADGVFAFFADGLYKFIVVGPDSTGPSDDVLYTWDNFLIQDFTTPTFSEGSSITSASAIAVGPEIWAHITGSTNIDTLSGTIPWVWLVFDGSLTLNHSASLLCPGSVNLTVQAGDVILLLNEGSSVWRIAGQMPNSLLVNRTDVSVVVSDSRTNSVDAPLTITSTTSGTPAAGIGTGILFRAESADENPSDVIQLHGTFSDVTAGSEDSLFVIYLRRAGAALAHAWSFAATGTLSAQLTHANTGSRIYTFQDSDHTIVGRDTTDTLTNKTLSGAVVTGAAGATPAANTIYTDSIVKAWVRFQVNGTIDSDLNVSSITDNGTGDWTVNWATAFASATSYCGIVSWSEANSGGTGTPAVARQDGANLPTASAFRVIATSTPAAGAETLVDVARIHVIAIGLQ